MDVYEKATGMLRWSLGFIALRELLVKHLPERLEHHRALVRKDVFQLTELAPAVRQTMTSESASLRPLHCS